MRFSLPLARTRLSILACMTLAVALSACATPTVLQRPASACSTLIPDDWKNGVEGAAPPLAPVVGEWIAFGDAQTGNLDKANGRTRDSITIVEKCEKRDAEAVRKLNKKWYQFWI